MTKKYDPSTPEWQLHSNMVSNRNLVLSYAADSERALEKMKKAQETADKYEAALRKLDPDYSE